MGRLVGDDKASSEALRIPPGRQEAFLVKVPSFAQAALMPGGPFLLRIPPSAAPGELSPLPPTAARWEGRSLG